MAEVKMPELSPKEYPGNPTKKQIQKVTTGQVSKRKKSLGSKFGETFLSADFASVIDNCVTEVVVPAVKNLLYDALIGGLEMTLWGELNHRSSSKSGSYIDYSARKKSNQKTRPSVSRLRKSFDDVFFDTKSDAYAVLDNLCSAIERYGEVSIADLNDLLGEVGEFTDNKYGWDSLSTAEIKRYKDGYLLVLPPVIPLDD